jgi:hypothetical protein
MVQVFSVDDKARLRSYGLVHFILQSLYTPWRCLGGEEIYSSYSFSTSALDGGKCSVSRLGRALPSGKYRRYSLRRKMGGPHSRLCRGSNPDSPAVQPTARHYTDWDTWLIFRMAAFRSIIIINIIIHCQWFLKTGLTNLLSKSISVPLPEGSWEWSR